LVRAAPKAAERLVEQAQADMSAFWQTVEVWTEDALPSQEILDERTIEDSDGKPVRQYLVRRVCLDLEKLKDPQYARLVKRFADSPRNGLVIEFYDAQRAAESILDRVDKATATKGSVAVAGDDDRPLDIRLQREIKGLSDDQLDELIRNIQTAEATARSGDAGAAPAPAEDPERAA
jgi:hypothetical protein